MTEQPEPPPLDDELAPTDDPYDELVDAIRAIRDHLQQLDDRRRELAEPDAAAKRREPAPWVVYTPPAAAGDHRHEEQDPGFTLENFVTWYNLTYTGLPGTRARPIPDCWP